MSAFPNVKDDSRGGDGRLGPAPEAAIVGETSEPDLLRINFAVAESSNADASEEVDTLENWAGKGEEAREGLLEGLLALLVGSHLTCITPSIASFGSPIAKVG